MNYFWLYLLVCCLMLTDSLTVNDSLRQGLMNKNKWQGDLAIAYSIPKYKVKSLMNRYWPSATVPYYIDPVHGECLQSF